MPLYEYQCQECGEKTEVVQRFADSPFTICSSCGGSLKKLFSAPAIQFKGSGFYKTDYASGAGKTTSSSTESSTDGEKAASSSKDSASTPAAESGSGSSSD